jgi:hypothetical protein
MPRLPERPRQPKNDLRQEQIYIRTDHSPKNLRDTGTVEHRPERRLTAVEPVHLGDALLRGSLLRKSPLVAHHYFALVFRFPLSREVIGPGTQSGARRQVDHALLDDEPVPFQGVDDRNFFPTLMVKILSVIADLRQGPPIFGATTTPYILD